MAQYLVLYLTTASAGEQMASSTPEEGQASMEAWNRWAAAAGSAVADLGKPLMHAFSVPDGESARGGLHVGGYSIMTAASADELRALLQDHPHRQAPGAILEVHEALELPGM